MAFQGYLYKFGANILPAKRYLKWQGVKANPNQRTEKEAFTNANNTLVRSTYAKTRSKLNITFRAGLTDSDYSDIFTIMRGGLQNATERKYSITYWNDESMSYKTGVFYLADPEFSYKQIGDDFIKYDEITFSFIEY